MRCTLLLTTLILISCNTSIDSSGVEGTISESHESQLIWVCHNPNSSNHGKICNEECLEPGNNSAFCWMFDEGECHEDGSESVLSVCRERESR